MGPDPGTGNRVKLLLGSRQRALRIVYVAVDAGNAAVDLLNRGGRCERGK